MKANENCLISSTRGLLAEKIGKPRERRRKISINQIHSRCVNSRRKDPQF